MIAATLTGSLFLAAAIVVALTTLIKAVHYMYVWLKQVDESLEYVKHEMQLNSGKTMRDAIQRMEERQINMELHLLSQDKTVIEVAAKLAEKGDV
jgi:hypothetical protein